MDFSAHKISIILLLILVPVLVLLVGFLCAEGTLCGVGAISCYQTLHVTRGHGDILLFLLPGGGFHFIIHYRNLQEYVIKMSFIFIRYLHQQRKNSISHK